MGVRFRRNATVTNQTPTRRLTNRLSEIDDFPQLEAVAAMRAASEPNTPTLPTLPRARKHTERLLPAQHVDSSQGGGRLNAGGLSLRQTPRREERRPATPCERSPRPPTSAGCRCNPDRRPGRSAQSVPW